VGQLLHLASLRKTTLSGVRVLAVSPDPPDLSRDLAARLGKDGPTLLADPALEVAAAYGARNRRGSAIIRPTWILIDREGRETWRFTESHTRASPPDAELAAAVAALARVTPKPAAPVPVP